MLNLPKHRRCVPYMALYARAFFLLWIYGSSFSALVYGLHSAACTAFDGGYPGFLFLLYTFDVQIASIHLVKSWSIFRFKRCVAIRHLISTLPRRNDQLLS